MVWVGMWVRAKGRPSQEAMHWTGLSLGLLDFNIWKARAALFSLNFRISEVDMLASGFLVPREESVLDRIPL